MNFLRTIWELFLEALYPSRCPVCNRILPGRKLRICPVCGGSFHLIEEHYCLKCGKPVPEMEEYCVDCKERKREFCQGRGVFLYNMQMKNSLLRYKYYGSREYGRYYAEEIFRHVGTQIKHWKPDVLVPVPMTRRKKRIRGFNQAEDLAEKIGELLQIPVAAGLAVKKKETKSQKNLNAAERMGNLKDAFVITESVQGLKILIVDDVYTTGSTIETLAGCLKESGAGEIYFVTLCIGQL